MGRLLLKQLLHGGLHRRGGADQGIPGLNRGQGGGGHLLPDGGGRDGVNQARQAIGGVGAGTAPQPGQLGEIGLATQQQATAGGQGGVPEGAGAQLPLGSAGGIKLKTELLHRCAALVQHMQSGVAAESSQRTKQAGVGNVLAKRIARSGQYMARGVIEAELVLADRHRLAQPKSFQADEEIRTLDPLLGKEMLYH
jgi:hypothetical protein